MHNNYVKLDLQGNASGLLTKGGTIIGTSNATNVFNYKVEENGQVVYKDLSDVCVENVKKDGFDGVCDASGNEIISPSQKYSSVVYQINSDGVHYFEVMKDGKSGACDMSGKEDVSTNYYSIIYDTEGFLVMDSENSNFRKRNYSFNITIFEC